MAIIVGINGLFVWAKESNPQNQKEIVILAPATGPNSYWKVEQHTAFISFKDGGQYKSEPLDGYALVLPGNRHKNLKIPDQLAKISHSNAGAKPIRTGLLESNDPNEVLSRIVLTSGGWVTISKHARFRFYDTASSILAAEVQWVIPYTGTSLELTLTSMKDGSTRPLSIPATGNNFSFCILHVPASESAMNCETVTPPPPPNEPARHLLAAYGCLDQPTRIVIPVYVGPDHGANPVTCVGAQATAPARRRQVGDSSTRFGAVWPG
jgi:hypothetical protein